MDDAIEVSADSSQIKSKKQRSRPVNIFMKTSTWHNNQKYYKESIPGILSVDTTDANNNNTACCGLFTPKYRKLLIILILFLMIGLVVGVVLSVVWIDTNNNNIAFPAVGKQEEGGSSSAAEEDETTAQPSAKNLIVIIDDSKESSDGSDNMNGTSLTGVFVAPSVSIDIPPTVEPTMNPAIEASSQSSSFRPTTNKLTTLFPSFSPSKIQSETPSDSVSTSMPTISPTKFPSEIPVQTTEEELTGEPSLLIIDELTDEPTMLIIDELTDEPTMSTIEDKYTDKPSWKLTTKEPTFSSPSISPTKQSSRLYDLVREFALYGGDELTDPKSYQSKAYAWLESHGNGIEEDIISMYSRGKIKQRYALACLFYSTNGIRNVHTDALMINKMKGKQIDIKHGTTINSLLTPPGWKQQENWLDTSVHVCEWYGITCYEQDTTDVKEIDLHGNQLTGSLPLELTLFKNLKLLDVHDNFFHNNDSSHDAIFTSLTSLQYLYYGKSYLESNTGVPGGIARMTNLIEYDCSYSLFHGPLDFQIFANIKSLQKLQVSGNTFNSSIPSDVGVYLPKIEYFYIDDANIISDLSYLGSLVERTKIIEHSINYNPEFDIGTTIPTEIGLLYKGDKTPPLEKLSITHSNNKLVGEIPSEIGILTNMRELVLNNNKLEGSVPSEIGLLKDLVRFQIENNDITGKMPSKVCALPSTHLLSSDCLYDDSTGSAKIECTCCTDCCSEEIPRCIPAPLS